VTEITIDIDAPTLSLGDAIQHCFDAEKKTFYRRMTKQNFALEQVPIPLDFSFFATDVGDKIS